jgi:hypothetical protein
LRIQRVRSLEGDALTGSDRVVLTVSSGFSFTFANTDDAIIAVFAGFDAIVPWLKNRECLVGTIDL